jgi:uncharacterized damage-inducible protein DinB
MDEGDRWLLDHFVITRAKTIELARRVPEEWWERVAPGEEHSVAKLFAHMADAVGFYLLHVLHDGQPAWPAGELTKASVIERLELSRDRLLAFFEADGGSRLGQVFQEGLPGGDMDHFSGRDRVSYLADHEIHHRGKIVLALRQWGMKDFPPLPFWSPRDYVYLERR